MIKVANQAANRHRGPAKVFDSEQEAFQPVSDGRIVAGDVVVVRYQGPKGGPGMPEMTHLTSAIVGAGLVEQTALLTDGRFGGGTQGISVGHISPEAAADGALAILRDGDVVEIDAEANRLHVDLRRRDRGQARCGRAPRPPLPDRRPREVRAPSSAPPPPARGSVRDGGRLREPRRGPPAAARRSASSRATSRSSRSRCRPGSGRTARRPPGGTPSCSRATSTSSTRGRWRPTRTASVRTRSSGRPRPTSSCSRPRWPRPRATSRTRSPSSTRRS